MNKEKARKIVTAIAFIIAVLIVIFSWGYTFVNFTSLGEILLVGSGLTVAIFAMVAGTLFFIFAFVFAIHNLLK